MKSPATKTTIAVFKALKKYGPIATPDLAEKMGKTPGTVDFYLRGLHAEPRQIYVAEIRDTDGRGRNARLWAVGNEPDVTKPKSKRNVAPTEAEIEAQLAAEDAKMRRAALAENCVRRDPFIAAFFGEFVGSSTNTLGEQGYGELRALSPRPEVICEGVA